MPQSNNPKRGDRVELAVVGLATMTMICLTTVNVQAEPEKDLSGFNAICLAVLTGCIAFVRGNDIGEFLNNNFQVSPKRTTTKRTAYIEYPDKKQPKYIEENDEY